MPEAPWLLTQSWHNLLFAHWRVDPSTMRRAVPDDFELDLFDGCAWLAIVPFYMTNVGIRGLPSAGPFSAFPELNVRTYVRVADRPGVYFFSLDAGRRLAVAAARALFNLPYYAAEMGCASHGHTVQYHSVRRSGAAEFKGTYEPTGVPFVAAAGTVEYFLTERYCLYHHGHRRRPYRLEIHHPPWSLQPARAEISVNTMTATAPVRIEGPPALLHFARRQDVVAWAPARLRDAVHHRVGNAARVAQPSVQSEVPVQRRPDCQGELPARRTSHSHVAPRSHVASHIALSTPHFALVR